MGVHEVYGSAILLTCLLFGIDATYVRDELSRSGMVMLLVDIVREEGKGVEETEVTRDSRYSIDESSREESRVRSLPNAAWYCGSSCMCTLFHILVL